MRLRRLCLEIFALRRFFKEPIAGVSVCRASEAQPKHRLSEIANAFGAKSRGFHRSLGLPDQLARRKGRTLSEFRAERITVSAMAIRTVSLTKHGCAHGRAGGI
jgi:hypothetical protein